MNVKNFYINKFIVLLLFIYFFLIFNNKFLSQSINFKFLSSFWQIRISDFIYIILLLLLLFNSYKSISFLNKKIFYSLLLILIIIIHSSIIKLFNDEFNIHLDTMARFLSLIILSYVVSIQFDKKEFIKIFTIFCYFFLIINSSQYIFTFLQSLYNAYGISQYNLKLYELYSSSYMDNIQFQIKINKFFNNKIDLFYNFKKFLPTGRVFYFTEVNLFAFVAVMLIINLNKINIYLLTIFLIICRSLTVLIIYCFKFSRIIKKKYLIIILLLVSIIALYVFRDLASVLKPRLFIFYKYIILIYDNPMLGVGFNNYLNPILHQDLWKTIYMLADNGNFINKALNYFLDNFQNAYNQSYMANFYAHEMLTNSYNINSPHNAFLQLIVEFGIIFSCIILFILMKIYKIEKNREVFIIIYYFCLNSFFPGNPETLILFIYLFLKSQIKDNI